MMDLVSVGGVRLEYRRIPASDQGRSTLVFLHEGLGAAAGWRDFPEAVAAATGCGAVVYSRAGYGGSDPVELPRPLTYMHEEALEVLPELLDALGIEDTVLVGHSDGASISLIYTGATADPRVRGLVLEAPHVFVEAEGLDAVAVAKRRFVEGDLRERLARIHGDNVDVAFWGWHDAWSDPGFLSWNLEEYLPSITCPVLLIQGRDDAYGTLAQIDAIARGVSGTVERLVLDDCGHAPHRERREEAVGAVAPFVSSLTERSARPYNPGT